MLGRGRMCWLFAFLAILILTLAVGVAIDLSLPLGLCCAALLPVSVGAIAYRDRMRRVANRQPRMNRLLTLFDHIETLAVDMREDVGGMGAFLANMAVVRVDILEVRGSQCDVNML